MKAKQEVETISVMEVKKERVAFVLVGESPLICNTMSEKARQELLAPRARKNAAEKRSTAKHDVFAEYRNSVYQPNNAEAPTAIALLATAFKGALRNAALDLPGAKKSEIGRLTYVRGDYVPIYGVPKLLMSITRSADMNHTPDVRTRAILPKWAAIVEVEFVSPLLRAEVVGRLMAAAGMTQGVGDWRPEKGNGGYGRFRLTVPEDPEAQDIFATGGKEAQLAALAEPEAYDNETEKLLRWYEVETNRTGIRSVA